LGSWIVIIVGIILAVAVFVLLITGAFSLASYLTLLVSLLALAGANLLALLASVLGFRSQREPWKAFGAYLCLALIGTVGLGIDILLSTLFSESLVVLLMVFLALGFFFLALLLGGDALLIKEFARLHMAENG